MEDIIYGRNSVMELLTSTSRTINKLLIIKGDSQGSIKKIISLAREKHIVISEVTKQKMDELAEGGNHQGVIALTTAYEYCEIDDILSVAKERKENPFIIILDGIEDPHNLGAIIRTCECAGVHGVIIPENRACEVNATVYKTSAGAVVNTKVAMVTNLTRTINDLKSRNIWVYALEAGNKKLYSADFTYPTALVIGSEGKGVSRLVLENVDEVLSIDLKGKVNSLNASNAGAIAIYEVVRQRSR